MQTESVMTPRITTYPPKSPRSRKKPTNWKSIFCQLTPEASCIEGFATDKDAINCCNALGRWIKLRKIDAKASCSKRNADGQYRVWIIYNTPPTSNLKPKPDTFK